MLLQEILRRIKFKIGTNDDISGRAINPIVNNRNIIDELNSQIRQYANITKGIQDIYSFPLNTNVIYVEAPSLALRSESYFHIQVIYNEVIFPIDMRGTKDVFKDFTTSADGIPNWFLPFNEGNLTYFGIFPKNSSNANATTLSANIDIDDTTIPVVSTSKFIQNNGRLTIGTEKIKYQYKDATNFYGCIRGVEMTTPASHVSTAAVTENNVIIFYSRLHVPIVVNDDDLIPQNILARDIEVCDEHIEGIIKAVAYNLLIKLDTERSSPYKIDYSTLYEQYKEDIAKNFYRGRNGTGIRQPSQINESGFAYGTTAKY